MHFFRNKKNITIIFDDGEIIVDSNNNFSQYEPLLQKGLWSKLKSIYNMTKVILSSKSIELKDNTAVIDGEEYSKDNPLFAIMELLHNKGIPVEQMDTIRPFLQNIAENPYINAKIELYDYLKAMDFEITADGCFLAYKAVNPNLTSVYDNTTRHQIGEYTEVTIFNTDRNVHCSQGLHFCSRRYLNSYNGKTIIMVKVNPKDVVSIPTDCNFEKGRCKRYKTIAILGTNEHYKTLEEVSNDRNASYEFNIIKNSRKNREENIRQILEAFKQGMTVKEIAEQTGYSTRAIQEFVKEYRDSLNKGE